MTRNMTGKKTALQSARVMLGLGAALGLAWAGCSSSDATTDPTVTGSTGTTSLSTTSGAGTGGSADVCPGGTLCGDTCTNTAFDPQNCGACGKACADGELCSMGTCGLGCFGGTTKCGDSCVDTNSSPLHCGECGKACGAGLLCAAGKCVLSCDEGGGKECNGLCADIQNDEKNCGDCGKVCGPTEVCDKGACVLECEAGLTKCDAGCVNLANDPNACGSCNKSCDLAAGQLCSQGLCTFGCLGGSTFCSGLCVDTLSDPKNCGGCDTKNAPKACKAGEVCTAGMCQAACGGNLQKCGSSCFDFLTDKNHCGDCNTICKSAESCVQGKCVACDSTKTDCDGDGWLVSEGDCCDKPGACGASPNLVNPGAVEVVGNGIDDNCNGKQDIFDTVDTTACDAVLSSNSSTAGDYAKALGICRTTTLAPALKKDKTWGLISAKLLRADGTTLPTTSTQRSIRSALGSVSPPTLEGQKAAVLSTGIASDLTQPSPGPASSNAFGTDLSSTVNIANCASASCIKDWFTTANPPLKKANELPVAPNCGSGNAGMPSSAHDSVMLELVMRAPTNARAFSLNTYFMSQEFPDYVCSDFNDQFAVLIDTPKPTSPVPNPKDKNLLVFDDGNGLWPIGINIASGTGLFNVCDLAAAKAAKPDVSNASCALGKAQLAGTNCATAGGTFWLTTKGNIVPGENVTLRIVIWDVGDNDLDSLALVDAFKWLLNSTVPGTSDGSN
ncbi:MAG: choice-of-anchor L domain-containing protein [Deltaproteobacteria bacterium]|nr:choice-of-anchor L domain-containing protein [Deltaproteobacteria bacterium]